MKTNTNSSVPSPAGPVYLLGGIGSLVYYLQLAHDFGAVVIAFLKSVVWPAFLTHDLLRFIGG